MATTRLSSRASPARVSVPTIAVLAFLMLFGAFVIDDLTPQTLVIAILFDIPIVMAAFTRSRGLTAALVGTALLANVGAAYVDAVRDGLHWEIIALEDRAFATVSIILVGYLSNVLQERAERVGRLAAQEARARREAALAVAADRIRAHLSTDVVTRAILREGVVALDGERAYWYPADPHEEALRFAVTRGEVEVFPGRRDPEIGAFVQRIASGRVPSVFRSDDPRAKPVLERLEARNALALPLCDRGVDFGVVLVVADQEFDETVLGITRSFANVAVNAIGQARLFASIAERNVALSERQDVIRDLVYALTHDLRTPLTALALTLGQAAEGAYGVLPERYGRILRDSRNAVDDLQRLAETLLLVARFETGERRAQDAPVDLSAVAREVASELQSIADARAISMRLRAQDALCVRGTRGELRRAVVNLVANALQHVPRGGTVEIELISTASDVRLSVRDDGYGIDPALRATLFERFSPGSVAGAGTGLGLYLVRRIAEAARGTVRYEPCEPRGSVFTLVVPEAA